MIFLSSRKNIKVRLSPLPPSNSDPLAAALRPRIPRSVHAADVECLERDTFDGVLMLPRPFSAQVNFNIYFYLILR